MSKLDSITVSYETGWRLRKVGFPQDTALTWLFQHTIPHYLVPTDQVTRGAAVNCAAPTLQEIIEALPPSIVHKRDGHLEADTYSLDTSLLRPGVFGCGYLRGDGLVLLFYDTDPLAGRPRLEESRAWCEHESPSEAAALLYLSLDAAGLIPTGEAQG